MLHAIRWVASDVDAPHVHGCADAQMLAVRDSLAGRQRLPWEDLSADDRRALGSLRRSVLALLQREPAARAAVDEVLRAWQDLFSATTTYTAASRSPQSDR
jgi:hypothetical protein